MFSVDEEDDMLDLGDVRPNADARAPDGPQKPRGKDNGRNDKGRKATDASVHPRFEGLKSEDLASEIPAPSVDEESEDDMDDLEDPGLPVMLIVFVCMLAVMGGVAVVMIHDAVEYCGCPLGINGCGPFRPAKESKSRFLVKMIQESALDVVPEWVYYVVSCVVGCTVVGVGLSLLPSHIAGQLKGGGTVQALTAVASGQPIPMSGACGRILVSCVYLGSGGSLGMEGPCIQVCTALATLAGQSLGINTLQTMSLLASLGFSCGFAASFNAPLSGILFAMEELQHVVPHLSASIICIILVAAACSTATVRLLHGNIPLFAVDWEPQTFVAVEGMDLNKVFGYNGWMLVAFPIGILCAFVTYVLVMSVRFCHKWLVVAYAGNWLSWRRAFILHGLLTGLIGAAVFTLTGLRGVWGVGAESVAEALSNDEIAVPQYFCFAVGKLLALLVAISVRGPGDTLEPVLISGAFLGGMCGKIMIYLEAGIPGAPPELVMKPCVIFGMCGLFASCFRFPLTPIVIVMELTGSDCYALVLPTILTCFIANSTSNRLCPPLLHEMMRQDGIDLHELAERTLAESRGLGGIDNVIMNGPKKAPKPQKAEKSGGNNHEDYQSEVLERRDRRTNTDMSVASSLGNHLERSLNFSGSRIDRGDSRRGTGGPRGILKGTNSGHKGGNPRFRGGGSKGRAGGSAEGLRRQTSLGSEMSGQSLDRRWSFSSGQVPPASVAGGLAGATHDQLLAELKRRLEDVPVAGVVEGGAQATQRDEEFDHKGMGKDKDMKVEDDFECALSSEIHLACSRFAVEDDSDGD